MVSNYSIADHEISTDNHGRLGHFLHLVLAGYEVSQIDTGKDVMLMRF